MRTTDTKQMSFQILKTPFSKWFEVASWSGAFHQSEAADNHEGPRGSGGSLQDEPSFYDKTVLKPAEIWTNLSKYQKHNGILKNWNVSVKKGRWNPGKNK